MLQGSILFLLLLLLRTPVCAQVEVELQRGGTLEGWIVATTDSSVTLRLDAGNGQMRDAELRRSDITFLEGTDEVIPPPSPEPVQDSVQAGRIPAYEFKHSLLLGLSMGEDRLGVSTVFESRTGHARTLDHIELEYMYTTIPRLWDKEHLLPTSRVVIPTSSLLISSMNTFFPTYRFRRKTEQIFYSHLIAPDLSVGGGFITESYAYHGYYPTPNRSNIIAGRAEFYLSDRIRIRETAGAG
ncbi:hypothetical protein KQI65_06945 [bacterium]|nr:hypothetical protein [bacterium]